MPMTNKDKADIENSWPKLPPLDAWHDTCASVHMWTQVVGKVLMLSPDINHTWGWTLYVTTRGLTTSPIPYGGFTFAIDFDFIAHTLRISTSKGDERAFTLKPMSVAEFYRKIMQALRELGIQVKILARPVEVEVAIPFEKDDQHASYDPDARSASGKPSCAPIGSSRSSVAALSEGKPCPLFLGRIRPRCNPLFRADGPQASRRHTQVADRVTQEAYSHEVSSAGLWPGTGLGEAAFYAYAYPTPEGFSKHPVQPKAAYFHDKLGEFILPYEAVRTAENPEEHTYVISPDHLRRCRDPRQLGSQRVGTKPRTWHEQAETERPDCW